MPQYTSPEPSPINLSASGTEGSSRARLFIGAVCALLVTGLILVGYAYLHNRHSQKSQAAATPDPNASRQAIGPRKAEILVDEPMFDGNYTIIGGTVRNISSDTLSALAVNLELKRREGGTLHNAVVPISPSQLSPQQEGHYSLRVLTTEFNSMRLASLTSGTDAQLLAYGTSKGKARPPEKLEGKTIYVNRPAPSKGEFINTPDTPGRVP